MTPSQLLALTPIVVLKGQEAFDVLKNNPNFDHLEEVLPVNFAEDSPWNTLGKFDNRLLVKLYKRRYVNTAVGALYYTRLPVMIFTHDQYDESRYIIDAVQFNNMVEYLKSLVNVHVPQDTLEVFEMDTNIPDLNV